MKTDKVEQSSSGVSSTNVERNSTSPNRKAKLSEFEEEFERIEKKCEIEDKYIHEWIAYRDGLKLGRELTLKEMSDDISAKTIKRIKEEAKKEERDRILKIIDRTGTCPYCTNDKLEPKEPKCIQVFDLKDSVIPHEE